MMKLVLVQALLVFSALGSALGKPAAGSQLTFVQHEFDEGDGRRLGGEGSGWGGFQEETLDKYCLERRKNKGKLNTCNSNKKTQLWRFTEDGTGHYDYGGFLQSKVDNKCLQVRGKIRPNAKVKVATCKKNKNQQWLSDGDTVSPEGNTKLCLYHGGDTIHKWDPAILLKCDKALSFNFGRA